MYNKLPKEVIILIYKFDPTYNILFNHCINEINNLIYNRDSIIEGINRMYWNYSFPRLIREYQLYEQPIIQ